MVFDLVAERAFLPCLTGNHSGGWGRGCFDGCNHGPAAEVGSLVNKKTTTRTADASGRHDSASDRDRFLQVDEALVRAGTPDL